MVKIIKYHNNNKDKFNKNHYITNILFKTIIEYAIVILILVRPVWKSSNGHYKGIIKITHVNVGFVTL